MSVGYPDWRSVPTAPCVDDGPFLVLVYAMLIHFWLPLVCYLMRHVIQAKYIEGRLVTQKDWAFLGRFCFLSEKGRFEYVIEYPLDFELQKLLLYFDAPDQWLSVYKSNKNCVEREQVLTRLNGDHVIELRSGSGAGCDKNAKSRVVRCQGSSFFSSARERWWFIALSNCAGVHGLNIKFRFLMTNGPSSEFWFHHFSADEFYILPILITSSFTYLILLVAVFLCTVELRSRNLLHTTYKLFVCSVFFEEFGIFLQIIHYVQFARDGIGINKCKTFGRLLEAVSETLFLLVLLLLAKGFTVTRSRLRMHSTVKLTVFMCLYGVTYLSIFTYEARDMDPGLVLYLYESPAGYGLLALRLLAWGMFLYAIIFSLKHYPAKSRFYYPFNILGSIWFIAGPIMIVFATCLIDQWVRESVVCGAFHLIALGGHLTFLALTMPSRVNKFFPYHVRTNHVGVMSSPGSGDSGSDLAGDFTQYAYAPSAPPAVSQRTGTPVELFTISRPDGNVAHAQNLR